MGLGKTIQIIAMTATIFKEHKRWPFLVIAPNSTIENWRREFRKWAPLLRVVVWPGTSEGREFVVQTPHMNMLIRNNTNYVIPNSPSILRRMLLLRDTALLVQLFPSCGNSNGNVLLLMKDRR